MKILVVQLLLLAVSFRWIVVYVDKSSTQSLSRIASNKQLSLSPPGARLDPRLLQIFTLGKKGLVEDFFHLWLVQIYGDPNLATDYEGESVISAAKTVMRHEPRIEAFYMLSCIVSFKDFNFPQECDLFLKKGLEFFPGSLRLMMLGGYVNLFELNRTEGAAAYYTLAARLPNAPAYVDGVVSKLLARDNLDTNLLLDILQDMQERTADANLTQWIKQKLDTLKPTEESTQP